MSPTSRDDRQPGTDGRENLPNHQENPPLLTGTSGLHPQRPPLRTVQHMPTMPGRADCTAAMAAGPLTRNWQCLLRLMTASLAPGRDSSETHAQQKAGLDTDSSRCKPIDRDFMTWTLQRVQTSRSVPSNTCQCGWWGLLSPFLAS
jgi:hypothetical protein